MRTTPAVCLAAILAFAGALGRAQTTVDPREIGVREHRGARVPRGTSLVDEDGPKVKNPFWLAQPAHKALPAMADFTRSLRVNW